MDIMFPKDQTVKLTRDKLSINNSGNDKREEEDGQHLWKGTHTTWKQKMCKTTKVLGAFQVVLVVKTLPAQEGDTIWSLHLEDPRRRAWQPTPVFLPGASHGQRSLAGYGP